MVDEFRANHKVVTVWIHNPKVMNTDLHASETSIGQSDCDVIIRSDELAKFKMDMEIFGRDGTYTDDIVLGGKSPVKNEQGYVDVY